MNKYISINIMAIVFCINIPTVYSAGMIPNTSAVLIEEQNKEGTIKIKILMLNQCWFIQK